MVQWSCNFFFFFSCSFGLCQDFADLRTIHLASYLTKNKLNKICRHEGSAILLLQRLSLLGIKLSTQAHGLVPQAQGVGNINSRTSRNNVVGWLAERFLRERASRDTKAVSRIKQHFSNGYQNFP